MDRIDIQIEVPALLHADLAAPAQGESSSSIQIRVERAYQCQIARQGKANSQLTTKEIDRLCHTDEAGVALLKQAISRLNLSGRAYHRILKVARTIADLSGLEKISGTHIAEAIQYRRFDKS